MRGNISRYFEAIKQENAGWQLRIKHFNRVKKPTNCRISPIFSAACASHLEITSCPFIVIFCLMRSTKLTEPDALRQQGSCVFWNVNAGNAQLGAVPLHLQQSAHGLKQTGSTKLELEHPRALQKSAVARTSHGNEFRAWSGPIRRPGIDSQGKESKISPNLSAACAKASTTSSQSGMRVMLKPASSQKPIKNAYHYLITPFFLTL